MDAPKPIEMVKQLTRIEDNQIILIKDINGNGSKGLKERVSDLEGTVKYLLGGLALAGFLAGFVKYIL